MLPEAECLATASKQFLDRYKVVKKLDGLCCMICPNCVGIEYSHVNGKYGTREFITIIKLETKDCTTEENRYKYDVTGLDLKKLVKFTIEWL